MEPLHLYQESQSPLFFAFGNLTGQDEIDITRLSGSDNAIANELVERSIIKIQRGADDILLGDLTLNEFDFCLAHIFKQIYGVRIPCEADCQDCDSDFEFSLNLSELESSLRNQVTEYGEPDAGIYESTDGRRRFRLPKISDLAELTPSNKKKWLKSFLVSGSFSYEALQEDIKAAGPVLSMSIQAACPNCDTINDIQFDIANYIAQTVRDERSLLVREIHTIAQSYGWPLSEILALDRVNRRQFAHLIVQDNQYRRQA